MSLVVTSVISLTAGGQTGRISQQTIDELRSLPYTAPSNSAPVVGVVTNSKFASPGYNFYADRTHNVAKLMALDGRLLHTWSRPNSSSWGDVAILPNGELLVIEVWDPQKKKDYPQEKGFPTRVVKLSPDSKVEWASNVPAHHRIELLRDGSFLTLTEHPRAVKSIDPTHKILDNAIAIVSAKGKLQKETSLYSAVSRSSDVRFKTVAPNPDGLIDLFHTNSVQRLDANSGFPSRSVLFCSRHQDLVGIVSPDGRLIWSWGQDDLSGPHAASFLSNGHILIFDNGLGRYASRVVEVDPKTKRIVWQYQADKPREFYSATGGYAERLPNGNTLITDSWQFTAFEVTPEPRIVWRFISPERSFLYRLNRYPADFFTSAFRRTIAETEPQSR